MPSVLQFVRSENVVSRVIAGETLIVPVRRGVADLASLFSFNQVGSTIWEAIEQPRTVDELVTLWQTLTMSHLRKPAKTLKSS